ncbi:hypothetical protein JCM8202v2_001856 [Rhodotorula sphaerocarpa]
MARGGTNRMLERTLDGTAPTNLKINLPRIRTAIAIPQAPTPILTRTFLPRETGDQDPSDAFEPRSDRRSPADDDRETPQPPPSADDEADATPSRDRGRPDSDAQTDSDVDTSGGQRRDEDNDFSSATGGAVAPGPSVDAPDFDRDPGASADAVGSGSAAFEPSARVDVPPRWDDQRDGVANDPSFGRAGDDDFGGGAGAQGTSDNFSGGRGAYDDFSGGGGMQSDRNPDPGYDDFGGEQGGASQDYGDGAGAMYDDSSYGPDRGWQGGRDFDRDAYETGSQTIDQAGTIHTTSATSSKMRNARTSATTRMNVTLTGTTPHTNEDASRTKMTSVAKSTRRSALAKLRNAVRHEGSHESRAYTEAFRSTMRCLYRLRKLETTAREPHVEPYPTAEALELDDETYDRSLEDFEKAQQDELRQLERRKRRHSHAHNGEEELLKDTQEHLRARAEARRRGAPEGRSLAEQHYDAVEALHDAKVELHRAEAHL